MKIKFKGKIISPLKEFTKTSVYIDGNNVKTFVKKKQYAFYADKDLYLKIPFQFSIKGKRYYKSNILNFAEFYIIEI